MRKILFTIIFALILIGLGGTGYLLYQKPETRNPKSERQPIDVNIPVERLDLEEGTDNAVPETSSESVLQILTSAPIAGFWAGGSNGDIFLLDYNGKVKQLSSLAKEPTIINENGLKNIFEVKPSADGSNALVNLTIFDTFKKQWLPMPAETTAAAWHPTDNQKVAYLKNDGLYLLDLVTGKSSSLVKFVNHDWQIDWPFANEIYLSARPTANTDTEIWKFDLKSKTLTKFLENESSLAVKWGDNWGLKLNTSSVIDKNGKLLFNLSSVIPQGLVLTLDKKCAVNSSQIYCALPNSFPESGLWPDDYLKKKVYTNDNIYQIDIDIANRTAKTKVLWLADEKNPIDGFNLLLQGERLLFINRYEQKLHSLRTK